MKNKKVIALSLIFIVIVALIIDAFIPRNLDDDFYNTDVINDVKYQSDLKDIKNKEYGVYAFLSDSDDSERDEFVISVLEVSGILKNKNSLVSYYPQIDDYVLNPKYQNMVNLPEWEIKKGSKYYGSIYCGIAPLDCKGIIIDGNDAKLHRMTFEINGKKADFYIYSCMIEENKYPENARMICTTQEGKRIQIEAVDSSEFSNVIEIK